MRAKRWVWLSIVCLLVFSLSPSTLLANESSTNANSHPDKTYQTGPLYQYFKQAAREFDVPLEILLAVSYGETRWQDHKGEPSQLNGYGVMHLADNPKNQSLSKASQLIGVPEKQLKTDIKQNIRGGAAVLASLAREQNNGKIPQKLGDWYTTVAAYSGLTSPLAVKWYADEVYKIINQGAYREINGKDIYLDPVKVTPNRGNYENVDDPVGTMATPDYPGARWVPAHSSNYTASNREANGLSIDYVIIHTTQGSYAGAISWFQNSSSNVSAHYVIRSSDGEITQMVQNKDIAWHAGNWTYNQHSIGIEHEGYVNDPKWYTDAMYRASANLTRWLCDKYGIPKTRSHIIGHNEVPGATHTDPGPNWNWTYYMSLVNGGGGDQPGIVVDNSTSGRFTASGNWGTSTWSSQKYGSDYRFITPQEVSDPAWFKINVPSSGNYDVYAWWPADSGYNDRAPYLIKKSDGSIATVYANQQANGGRWNLLGTFSLAAGDYDVIGVSRWTGGTGYVIADAVKIVKR